MRVHQLQGCCFFQRKHLFAAEGGLFQEEMYAAFAGPGGLVQSALRKKSGILR